MLIRHAEFPDDAEAVRAIFRDYVQWLGIDLSFQDFEAELAQLPGKYAKPQGLVLLAHIDGVLAGCIALRPHDEGCCEMKRLFVRDFARGTGLGKALVDTLLIEARRLGYRRMLLDTLPRLTNARGIYVSVGFRPTSPYIFNPEPDAEFWELAL